LEKLNIREPDPDAATAAADADADADAEANVETEVIEVIEVIEAIAAGNPCGIRGLMLGLAFLLVNPDPGYERPSVGVKYLDSPASDPIFGV
jgi:hypothetical protein